MSRKQIITALTVIYISALTILCLVQISAPTPDLQVIGFDKVVHFCFYFGLNTLLVSTIIAKRGNAKVTHIIATTLASIAYGVAIEFIQKEVGRDFDIYDIAANAIGSITAAAILLNSKVRDLIKSHLQ
ncbi:MAG: VanZ family protein [bacterium]